MIFKPYPGTRREIDLLTKIAPVFRIDSESGEAHLVGTGFWITDAGHLVTAWHVVEENISGDGIDRGPIFAVQTFPDRSIAVRNFRKSDKHPSFDLALIETVVAPPAIDRPTSPITISLDELGVGDPVFSFSVSSDDQVFADEKLAGHTVYRFVGELLSEVPTTTLKFAVRLSFGHVSQIFEKMRDRVMLPFPCIQTDVPIYGGNSGGPLFDVRGRVCAVHCTSFGGTDVAFHVPIQGVLRLQMSTQSMGMKDSARKYCSVLELGVTDNVSFDPPMLDADGLARSFGRWIWYAIKCIARRERPSANVHFATANEMRGRPKSQPKES